MKYGIARAINGISINGLEWLLNDDNSVMEFDDYDDAIDFVIVNITDFRPCDYVYELGDEHG